MSAPPVKRSLKIYQGATFRDQITWRAGAPASPVDLTGATARMQARTRIDSPAPLIELTTANGGVVLGGAAGTVTLFLSATQTAAITWTGGVYDLEVTFPSGDVRRLFYGSVAVSPEVTR